MHSAMKQTALSIHLLLAFAVIGNSCGFVPSKSVCGFSSRTAAFQDQRTTRMIHGSSKPHQHRAIETILYSVGKKVDLVFNPDKDLLTKAYRRGCYLFVSLAAILFLIPDRTATAQLATKFGGAAGYGMAGGLCHILAGANDHDRLGSDTYTRLNIGLLGFCALGIMFVPAEAGFFFKATPAIIMSLVLTIAQGYGILLSFLGWKRGVDPAGTVGLRQTPQNLVEELREGTKNTLRGLRVDNAKKALFLQELCVVGCFWYFLKHYGRLF